MAHEILDSIFIAKTKAEHFTECLVWRVDKIISCGSDLSRLGAAQKLCVVIGFCMVSFMCSMFSLVSCLC